jgi:CCR4-NOT transcriptional regulation complex NOT5 subunit
MWLFDQRYGYGYGSSSHSSAPAASSSSSSKRHANIERERNSPKSVLDVSKYLLSFVPRSRPSKQSPTDGKDRAGTISESYGSDDAATGSTGHSKHASSSNTRSTNKQSVRPVQSTDETAANMRQQAPAQTGKTGLCCDKCDGKHLTDDCPYYRKKREDHPDAQKGFYRKLVRTVPVG